MSPFRSAAAAAILAGVASFLVLPVLLARTPASVASLALGTDEAFAASGLEPRENQIGGGALRWLKPDASFRFTGFSPGLVEIDLVVRGHPQELTVTANGAIIGTVPARQGHFGSKVSIKGSALVVGITTPGFAASGRDLGTQIVSLTVSPAGPAASGRENVPRRLWLAMATVMLAGLVSQQVAGSGMALALVLPALLLTLILPAGLWRSAWLLPCVVLLSTASVLAAWVSRSAVGGVGARRWLQIATLVAVLIHGVLPASPWLSPGDAQLHGNKISEVAAGNLFPTSRTDHRPPFEIPYGFSFYGLLSPWASSGVANVMLAREGAAMVSALSALALALVLGRTSASLAAATLFLWTFLPVNLRTMGFGNLSNVFAQGVLVLFLLGAATPRTPYRFILLAFLAALSGTAHLSSYIVLLTLLVVAALVPQDRQGSAFKPLVFGVAISTAYYAAFLPMILAQTPRLLGERGGSGGVFDPWRLKDQLLIGVGWPLILLVAFALLARRATLVLPLTRSLALTGLFLAIMALVSPVEVRYLLAVSPLIAMLGASVVTGSWPGREEPGRIGDKSFGFAFAWGRGGRFLALTLACLAVLHGARVLLDFMPLSGV